MNIDELETVLSKFEITRPKIRVEKVELSSLPNMLLVFRSCIKNEIPPTQSEFVNKFISEYPDLKNVGVVARLKRAYLSYIREYHLGYLLKEIFSNVYYDEQLDISGIDFVINYNNKKYYLHAYVDTKAGNYWREIKNNRHNFFGEHIDLPLDLNKGKKVGKFLLYKKSDILSMKRKMDSNQRNVWIRPDFWPNTFCKMVRRNILNILI